MVFSHCYPIPTVVFQLEQAVKGLYTFVKENEGGLWSGELLDNKLEKMVSSVDKVRVIFDSGSQDGDLDSIDLPISERRATSDDQTIRGDGDRDGTGTE